jgi:hypothetical protein
MRAGCFCLAGLISGLAVAHGQLAITEVLSVSRENTNSGFHGAEFWELTNFGTNDVNLNGYGFRDSKPGLRRAPFNNLVIRGGESVIFFRIEPNNDWVVTPEHFKAWWGQSKLPSQLQCRTYEKPGLSAWDGDELWVFDDAGNLVDSVRFGPSGWGFSFTYDSNTGHFGSLSESGTNGAFTADLTSDVGSPGTTAGPVPVQFLTEPADIEADGGMTVTFQAIAGGLPAPRYQWVFQNIPIPGATASSLALSDVQPSDAGPYRLIITNGLSTATSGVAHLSVNTNPTAPGIMTAPADYSIFIGQTAAFAVSARGYPPPTYQWQINGVNIVGAVSPTLELVNVGVDLNGARISVIVSNSLGSTSALATLTVTHWPDLRFTELMAFPARAAENRVFGWVELTNFDTNTIDLTGWRFAEEYSFERAVTITNSIRLAPRESLVIAERLDKVRFGRWWGERELPENFKLHTYSGFGLETNGGAFFLWNTAARDPFTEFVAELTWASSTAGVSYECECLFYEGICMNAFVPSALSTLGMGGAFRSKDGLDLGSPGYTDSPPLEIISVTREPAARVAITCKVIAGKSYQLWRSGSLAPPAWLPGQTITASNNVVTFIEDAGIGSAFYRVRELP